MPWLAAFLPVVTGIIGNIAGADQRQAALNAAQNAFNVIQNTGAPPDLAQAIILDQFKQAGVYTPELEQQINQGVSQMSKIQQDPALASAQMSALNQLGQQAQTGMNASDQQAYNQMRNQVNQNTQGNVQAILQNAQQRGTAGAGTTLAAQLQAAQSGANNANQQGYDIAGGAANRALQALGQYGNMANTVQNQNFNQQAQIAQAQDAINNFNTSNAVAQQARNVGAQQQAGQLNLGNLQNASNANVAQQNQEYQREVNAQNTDWQNQLGLNQAISTAGNNLANVYNGQAAQTANTFSGIGGGLAQGAGAIGNQNNFNTLMGLLNKNGLGSGSAQTPANQIISDGSNYTPDASSSLYGNAFSGQGNS